MFIFNSVIYSCTELIVLPFSRKNRIKLRILLIRIDTVYFGRWIPEFRCNRLPLSSQLSTKHYVTVFFRTVGAAAHCSSATTCDTAVRCVCLKWRNYSCVRTALCVEGSCIEHSVGVCTTGLDCTDWAEKPRALMAVLWEMVRQSKQLMVVSLKLSATCATTDLFQGLANSVGPSTNVPEFSSN